MINKENLELFTCDRLRYKDHIKIEYWDLTNNSLHIVFVGGFGEIININTFNEWFVKRRDEKINEILD